MSHSLIIVNECKANTFTSYPLTYDTIWNLLIFVKNSDRYRKKNIKVLKDGKINFEKLTCQGNFFLSKRVPGVKYFIYLSLLIYLPIYDEHFLPWRPSQEVGEGLTGGKGGGKKDGGFRRYLGVIQDNTSRIEKWGPLSQCKRKIRAANVNAHRTSCTTGLPSDCAS